MKKYAYLTFIIFSFSLAFCLYKEHLDKKTIIYANEVLERYIKDPTSEGMYALEELHSLTQKNPGNVQVRSIYLNILLLENSTFMA